MLETESGWVKTQWVHILRVFYCLPLMIAEIIAINEYSKKLKSALTKKHILGLLLTPVVFGYAQFALIYGADNII